MNIHIEFCIKWNYGPEFERVSNIIKKYNSEIKIESNNSHPRSGAFEVMVDNNLVFSKFSTKRFPFDNEIKSWIKSWIIFLILKGKVQIFFLKLVSD